MDQMTAITFEPFPKLARLNREITITEKIDGTNAQIIISDDGVHIGAASRNRLISPEDDNMGFAKWVQANKDALLTMGPGRHFGEWWGQGVARCTYGLKEKRFSLFNTRRWSDDATRPACCHVVPVLFQGAYSQKAIEDSLGRLREMGSVAVPGFMKPEGIVVWHDAARQYFKVTLENDEMSKGEATARGLAA